MDASYGGQGIHPEFGTKCDGGRVFPGVSSFPKLPSSLTVFPQYDFASLEVEDLTCLHYSRVYPPFYMPSFQCCCAILRIATHLLVIALPESTPRKNTAFVTHKSFVFGITFVCCPDYRLISVGSVDISLGESLYMYAVQLINH